MKITVDDRPSKRAGHRAQYTLLRSLRPDAPGGLPILFPEHRKETELVLMLRTSIGRENGCGDLQTPRPVNPFSSSSPNHHSRTQTDVDAEKSEIVLNSKHRTLNFK